MLATIKFTEDLFEKLQRDIGGFVGQIIDISEAPLSLSSGLNIELAGQLGVTQQQLAIQIAENRIRELAFSANVEVICLWKDQIQQQTKLIKKLLTGRLILFK